MKLPALIQRLGADLRKPPGRWSNRWAIAAAVLTFLSLLTPGSLQIIPPDSSSFKTLLAMPLHGLLYSHLGGLFGLLAFVSAPIYFVQALTLGEAAGFWHDFWPLWSCLPAVIWMLLSWNWLLRAIVQCAGKLRTPRENRRPITFLTRRWLTAPLLALALYGLWFTQLPLKANFALQKEALESIADEAITSPSGTIEFAPAKSIGLMKIEIAHRLPRDSDGPLDQGKQAGVDQLDPQDNPHETSQEKLVTSIPTRGMWAHQGFVRDLSRMPGEIEADTFSFQQNSNHGDQEIYYLWDGWYAFQNLLD